MANKCNRNCQVQSNGDCLVNQSPESCSFYEHQKDVDITTEQQGNTIIKDDYKKSYYKQEKKEKKNTILSDDNSKYRVKD